MGIRKRAFEYAAIGAGRVRPRMGCARANGKSNRIRCERHAIAPRARNARSGPAIARGGALAYAEDRNPNDERDRRVHVERNANVFAVNSAVEIERPIGAGGHAIGALRKLQNALGRQVVIGHCDASIFRKGEGFRFGHHFGVSARSARKRSVIPGAMVPALALYGANRVTIAIAGI